MMAITERLSDNILISPWLSSITMYVPIKVDL